MQWHEYAGDQAVGDICKVCFDYSQTFPDMSEADLKQKCRLDPDFRQVFASGKDAHAHTHTHTHTHTDPHSNIVPHIHICFDSREPTSPQMQVVC